MGFYDSIQGNPEGVARLVVGGGVVAGRHLGIKHANGQKEKQQKYSSHKGKNNNTVQKYIIFLFICSRKTNLFIMNGEFTNPVFLYVCSL